MRCTQFIGLSEAAQDYLSLGEHHAYTEYVKHVFPDGSEKVFDPVVVRHPNYECRDSGRLCGMFDDVELTDYVLPDGTILEERPQETYWSSGPMIYTALWNAKTGAWVKETLWTAKRLAEDGVYVNPENPVYEKQEIPKPH